MPFTGHAEFNPNAALGAVTQGFGALGAGIDDMKKKREEAEAQLAGSMFGFETLKKAGLVSEEEQQKFLAGNANARNAIVMAATPRLLQKYRDDQQQQQEKHFQMQQALQERIAQMHWNRQGVTNQPQIDPGTGMIWNGRQWVQPRQTAGQSKGLINKSGLSVDDLNTPNLIKYYQAKTDNGEIVPDLTSPVDSELYGFDKSGKRTNKVDPSNVLAIAPGGKPVPYQQWQAAADAFKKAHGALTGQAPMTQPQAAPAPALKPQDQQALAWAQANPQDPRAAAILKKLGQ